MLNFRKRSRYLFIFMIFVLIFSLPLTAAARNPKAENTGRKLAKPANTEPAVKISSPASGTTFTAGTSITFSGTANDAEDGDLSKNLAWKSSVNGSLGTGGSVSTAGLSAGTHTITATATDSKGAYSTSQITITVSASVTEGVPCNILGMIPNDASKGSYNYNILIVEAKKGTKININGTYYLNSPYYECVPENEVIAGLNLVGESP